jgi:hypothetical protein
MTTFNIFDLTWILALPEHNASPLPITTFALLPVISTALSTGSCRCETVTVLAVSKFAFHSPPTVVVGGAGAGAGAGVGEGLGIGVVSGPVTDFLVLLPLR